MIESTCDLIDKKLLEMDVDQEGSPVRISFLGSRVEAFRECIDDNNNPSPNEVLVYFKSGVRRSY